MKTFILSMALLLAAILLFISNGMVVILTLCQVPFNYLSKITTEFGDELLKQDKGNKP